MFLKLAHTNLEVYKKSYALILEAYKITKALPDSERFNLISQLRRASLSVRLNIAEGSSRKSPIGESDIMKLPGVQLLKLIQHWTLW